MGNDNDGVVVIGTRVSTSQLKQDLKEAERELLNYSKEMERLTEKKAKIDIELQNYEEAKRLIQEATDKDLEQAQTTEQVNWLLDMEQMQLQKVEEEYAKVLSDNEKINQKIKENVAEQERLKNVVKETSEQVTKSEMGDLLSGASQKKVEALGRAFKTIGTNIVSSTTGVSQRITRSLMPLVSGKVLVAIMGIFAVILGVVKIITNAFKNLTTNNEKMKNQWTEIKNTISNMVQQVGNAIAQVLQPLIQWMLDAIQKMIQYLGYLLKAWFGIDIYAKSTSKSIDKANKSAGKLRKTIAGFDEMNILNDNTGAAGGIADGINNNLLKPLSELETPDWLKVLGFMGLKSTLHNMAILWNGYFSGEVQKGLNWLTGKSDWVHDHLGENIGTIYDIFVGRLQDIKDEFDKMFKGIEETYDLFIIFIKQVFAGDWEGAWKTLKKIFSTIWDSIMAKLNIDFKVSLPGTMYDIGVKLGEGVKKGLKWAFNLAMDYFERKINSFITTINNFTTGLNYLFGSSIKPISFVKLPRLAKGGIINQPGRGVPVGSAIAGESGREGVIPLTDSQQMELLGEAIGKYITVNANIVNTMNGRVISRELQKVQNDSNFAYNR